MSYVAWLVELSVKPGQLDAFRALVDEMVEGTSQEPGTTAYEWMLSADGTTCHIYERYATPEAADSHSAGFVERWAARFGDCVDMKRLVIYGSPNDAVKERFAGANPEYLGAFKGFTR